MVHIGPYLTTLILTPENEQNEDLSGFNAIWDYIPVSSSDSTVLLCHNAITNLLKGRILSPTALLNVSSNVILVEYGFQVKIFFIYK